MNKKLRLPIVWLIISIMYTTLVKLVDVYEKGGAINTRVGFSHINYFFANLVPYNETIYKFSSIIALLSFVMIAIFGLKGLIQLIQRKNLWKVDKEILGLGIMFIITLIIYIVSTKISINYRPVILPNEGLEYSFPSSHTLMVVVVFGGAGLIFRRRKGTIWQMLAVLSYILLCLIVGTRLMSGTHWLTDIIGGILYGVTLLSFYKHIVFSKD